MGETKELAKKKKFKMPHTLVIIFIIILAAVLFTWIVPSGEYVQIEDPVTGRELIDPNSFHFVENTPVNPLRIMNYIIDGFMDAADLIFMLMFAGGPSISLQRAERFKPPSPRWPGNSPTAFTSLSPCSP